MTIKLEPTKELVKNWIENFVPVKDLFFIEEKAFAAIADHISEVLVIPIKEFFEHSSYTQIQLVNSYMYWNISKKVNFVLVAQPDWITKLPVSKKRDLLFAQFKLGRGLIFPLSAFSLVGQLPEDHIFEEEGEKFIVIQRNMWNELSDRVKEDAIQAYAQLWDNWIGCEVPVQTPQHLKEYANTFTTKAGSNCLAATLFAITKQDWIIEEWVHPNSFLNGLERANYSRINEPIQEEDVVAWVNNDGVIQHAAYHITDHYFFNKNGQTFFNPWKIVHYDQLNEEWSQYKTNVYRKR